MIRFNKIHLTLIVTNITVMVLLLLVCIYLLLDSHINNSVKQSVIYLVIKILTVMMKMVVN